MTVTKDAPVSAIDCSVAAAGEMIAEWIESMSA
jgi:hypothetical protein